MPFDFAGYDPRPEPPPQAQARSWLDLIISLLLCVALAVLGLAVAELLMRFAPPPSAIPMGAELFAPGIT